MQLSLQNGNRSGIYKRYIGSERDNNGLALHCVATQVKQILCDFFNRVHALMWQIFSLRHYIVVSVKENREYFSLHLLVHCLSWLLTGNFLIVFIVHSSHLHSYNWLLIILYQFLCLSLQVHHLIVIFVMCVFLFLTWVRLFRCHQKMEVGLLP